MSAGGVLARVVLAVLLALGAGARAQTPGLTASDAWIAAGPPTARVHAGYLRVVNDGAAPATLTGVESPRFGRVEMHRTELRDGIGTMRRETAIGIAPGGSTEFAPGGLHLMLFDAAQSPVPGESVPLTLHFADGRQLTVDAVVRVPVDRAGRDAHRQH